MKLHFLRSIMKMQCFCRNMSSHNLVFYDFFNRTAGRPLEKIEQEKILRKHPNLEHVTQDRIDSLLNILNKFLIFKEEAIFHPHLFTMNPITLDNYATTLQECGFIEIRPKHIMRYHTLVRMRTVEDLKKINVLPKDRKLIDKLLECFEYWPSSHPMKRSKLEDSKSILQTRMEILQTYLNWRLGVTGEEFSKYLKNYLVIKHRPFSDIKEAITLAIEDMKFSIENIRRHGFLISADPTNTKMILENITHLAGIEVRNILRMNPAIVKNSYDNLVRIRAILEEFRISDDIQRRSLLIYCMCPESVRQRLTELMEMKEFQALRDNPRVLQLVVHKRKMLNRLNKLRDSNKQCFSLDSLITSKKVFDVYANRFGDKMGGRDVAAIIYKSLNQYIDQHLDNNEMTDRKQKKIGVSGESISLIASPIVTSGLRTVNRYIRRHAYCRHATTGTVADNLTSLREKFNEEDIYINCHLLLYPSDEISTLVNDLLHLRESWRRGHRVQGEHYQATIDYGELTDSQILALSLYTMERQHHFSGDGIWSKIEKADLKISM